MIVTAIDAEFLPALQALHNSIRQHSPDTPLICMTYGDDGLADKVDELGIEVLHNATIDSYLPGGDGTAENCQPMYARLLAPELFGDCVWMDADQVVQDDLTPLLQLQFSEAVAAVPDAHNAQRSVIGYEVHHKHALMSGLMVLNADKWQGDNVTQRCIDIMQMPDVRFRLVVQSVLNVALAGQFYPLPAHWQGFANRKTCVPKQYKVLHWHGRERKPWTDPSMPNAEIWRRYSCAS